MARQRKEVEYPPWMGLTATRVWTDKEGGCNFCVDPEPEPPKEVWELRSAHRQRILVARICDTCMAVLQVTVVKERARRR